MTVLVTGSPNCFMKNDATYFRGGLLGRGARSYADFAAETLAQWRA